MNKKLLLLSIFIINFSFSQTKEEVNRITSNYDFNKLNELKSNFENQYKKEHDNALKLAKINNWPITKTENGNFMELQRVSSEGKPIYYSTYNLAAAKSSRANFLYNNGGLGLNIEGQGMIAFVWDGGIAMTNHQEFMVNGSSKVTVADGASTTSDHSTHVMGTMIAQGTNNNAKGMASQAIGYSLDWNNDTAEVTSAVGFGMLISNHSYGVGTLQSAPAWYYGAYSEVSRAWDQVMFNAPYYLLCNAAGNEGQDTPQSPLEGNDGYDKLSEMATSKNSMTVANAYDAIIDTNDGSIIGGGSIVSSSSQGPTDDYRIKPDITGNGYNLYSPIDTSTVSYAYYTGTSMASPSVAGTLLLLQQLANQEMGNFMLAATLKGLALHTADDKGLIGPDAKYGWGYINAKKAAELILSDTDIIQEKTLNNNESFTFEVTTDGTTPLIASISWTDAPGEAKSTLNDITPVLVNDLDIRISKSGTTYLPWKLTGVNTNAKGDNNVDPFENILINDPTAGTYTITVNHKGILNDGLQNYSLIVSGITSSTANIIQNKITDFEIYPNPTSNGIIKIAHNNLLNNGVIKIYTILGKEIYSNKISKESIQNINVSNLETGIYYISIIENNIKTTKKLIIK